MKATAMEEQSLENHGMGEVQKELSFNPLKRFWLRKPRRQPRSYSLYKVTAKEHTTLYRSLLLSWACS